MTALTADRMADYPWTVALICFGVIAFAALLHAIDPARRTHANDARRGVDEWREEF